MTALNQIVALGNGTVRAQAGIRLADIETAARPTGWELRCMPSTFRLASLGGLYGGGFGGIGSINYGPLAAPGNVLSVKVMTVEPVPRVLTVPAPEALLLHHAYGTNGIILEVELALAPVHQWIERLDVFDDFADALNYANACVRSPGLVKRQVALLATPIADYFSHLNDRYRRAACGYQPDRRGERRTLRQPVTAPSREQRHPSGQRRGPDAKRLVNGILLEPHHPACAQGGQYADLSADGV
jgi:hypothetical protein